MLKSVKQHKKLRSNPIQNQPQIPPPTIDSIHESKLAPPALPFFEDVVLFAYKSRQYIKCVKIIERILKVTPKENSRHYKILLAAANTMIGKNFKRSHNLLNSVLYSNPFDAYALYGKGVAFYFEKKFDKSIEFFDRAIDADESGMEQAKEMKIKAQVESKQIRVVLEKIKVNTRDTMNGEIFEQNGIENSKKFGSSVDDGSDMDLDVSLEDYWTENSMDASLKQAGKNGSMAKKVSESPLNSPRVLRNEQTVIDKISQKTKYSRNFLNKSSKYKNGGSESTITNEHISINDKAIELKPQLSSETFKNFQEIPTTNLDNSLEENSADLMSASSASSFAQQNFNKALDFYMLGQLEKSLKYFQKSLKLEPDFEEADEMGTKAQEFIDLLDVVDINMTEKNYAAIVEICTEGLDIDEGNDAINRKFYFYRGLAYFHMGDNEKSLKDYGEYERLGMKIEELRSDKVVT